MPNLPRITQTIKDGGLGLSEGDASGVCVKIGVSSAGTVNALKFFTDPDTLKAEYGSGPLVDSAVYHLQTAGGPVGVMRINSSIAGAAGSVTPTRATPGDSTGTVAVAGAAYDSYDVKVEITLTGTLGTAAFKYTLDGGDNYSDEIAIPGGGSYPIPGTNLTLTFTANGGPTFFRLGDVFAFTCTAPGYSSTDVSNAHDALRTTYATSLFGFVHLVGQASSSAGAATIATTVDTKMSAEEVVFRYFFTIVEWPDEADATIQASVASFTSVRVLPVAGFVELVANGRIMKRSAGSVVASRLSQQKISRDLGRTKPDKEGGPVAGVNKLYRDEFVTPGLDDYGFTTMRTFPGKIGSYITHGKLRAPPGSDYKFIQYRRVMDRACTLNYEKLFPHLNDDEFLTKDDGTIDEVNARALESEIRNHIKAELVPAHASEVIIVVSREEKIVSTQKLKTKVRIRPKGYAKFIDSEIGFENVSVRPQ